MGGNGRGRKCSAEKVKAFVCVHVSAEAPVALLDGDDLTSVKYIRWIISMYVVCKS